jgi:hypothetical protein
VQHHSTLHTSSRHRSKHKNAPEVIQGLWQQRLERERRAKRVARGRQVGDNVAAVTAAAATVTAAAAEQQQDAAVHVRVRVAAVAVECELDRRLRRVEAAVQKVQARQVGGGACACFFLFFCVCVQGV